jgi:hypothetical protein
MVKWGLFAAASIVAVLVIAGLAASSFSTTNSPRAPGEGAQVNDHWHATLVMEICDEAFTLPESSGGVHSHGDGLMHIHPFGVHEAGSNANVGRFFDSFPMTAEPDRIQPPGRDLLRNGDACPGREPGQVLVLVNGEDITETFRDYAPSDGDQVEVYFR